MDKLKMHSPNKVDKNIESIGKLFPNCIVETKNEKGEIEQAIDFDLLRQELSKNIVEGNKERYQFTWPDKKKSILLANSPIEKTLRPCREESVDFDNTENLYIEGDNLDVLKLLQETYLNKVKMIYIDPPYNTGNDFVYEDNFAQNTKEYLENSGQYDDEGNRLSENKESNGRFHTDWLNMIYPRIKVAKDLLTDDGIIFISIDDHEVENLRKICDEIFGERNFITEFIWQNKKGGGNDSSYVAIEHEYVLSYAKSKQNLNNLYEKYTDKYLQRYNQEDAKGKFYWDTFKRKSGKQYYPIECPDGEILEYDEDHNPISWLRSKETFEKNKIDGEISFTKTKDSWSIKFKQRLPQGKKPRSIFTTKTVLDDLGTTSSGSSDMYNYFSKDVFSNPKPIKLIEFFLGFGVSRNDYILDFFSGSGTTAEAIFKSNIIDKGNRKFILVQLPEKIYMSLKKYSSNAKLITKNAISILKELNRPFIITEIGKERIRRAGKKIVEELEEKKKDNKLFDKEDNYKLDTGFRVLKLDTTNMKDVYYDPSKYTPELFSSLTDNIKEDRTPEDLLFQVMLELGVPLSYKIKETTINDKKVFNVNNNYLIACFDDNITDGTVTYIAKLKPIYAVFRDSSMASDSVATNFEQLFKTYSPETIRKVL